ncbi:heavy-metal-associated domain-containing protein [Flavobacterium tibetense]|jgi:periplasmic mercuric ion binding protein|uniref:Heavy metal transporter n=1 Tax=Flavobacterium tibetense TaxID=2233533 RepID=A0A365P1P7_9FLAO|nr:heavy metal-associated domain-containing protein [Flavobacterium tibetense]RBA28391.1 heavy metal transporter [Flavobacterium tibetense]
MKNLKFIAIATFALGTLVSCKNDAKETTEKTTISADAELATTNLTIDGMTCEIGCAKLIEGKLQGLNGVKEAKVDFETKTASITYDVSQQDITSLTATVEKAGGGELYKVVENK